MPPRNYVETYSRYSQEEYGNRLTELGQLLGVVRGQLFEAQTMAELEMSLQPTSALVKLNDAYYEADASNHPTGEAYCMHCWEADGVKHHLHRWYENERVNICSYCETKY